MDTQSLQINLAQRILSTTNEYLLQKVNSLLNKENIFGFDADGNAISDEQYISELKKLNDDIDNGNVELLTSDEVRKNIINEYRLDQKS